MRLLFMGTPDFAVPSLQSLHAAGHYIAGVVTQPDRPGGRGKKLRPSPVKQAALGLGLTLWQPEKIKNSDFIGIIKKINPTVIIVVAFGQILPREILEIPTGGCINLHASLLPRYRGAAPIHRAVINGETETGVTTMFMDVGLDTGDMLLSAGIPIATEDNVGSVHDRLSRLGADLLVKTIDLLERGEIKPVPQDDARSTYASMLTQSDEVINWNDSALSIFNRVRGMDPWPGARTLLGDKVLKIWRASFPGSPAGTGKESLCASCSPGSVVAAGPDALTVMTGTGPLEITELQLQGGRRLLVQDFLRGKNILPGAILGGPACTRRCPPLNGSAGP